MMDQTRYWIVENFELDDVDTSGPPSVVNDQRSGTPVQFADPPVRKNKAWEL